MRPENTIRAVLLEVSNNGIVGSREKTMRKQKTERAPHQESEGDLCNSRDHRPSAIYSGGGIWGKMECWFRRKRIGSTLKIFMEELRSQT